VTGGDAHCFTADGVHAVTTWQLGLPASERTAARRSPMAQERAAGRSRDRRAEPARPHRHRRSRRHGPCYRQAGRAADGPGPGKADARPAVGQAARAWPSPAGSRA